MSRQGRRATELLQDELPPLDATTVHLAHQIYQYYEKKGTYIDDSTLIENLSLIEIIVSVYRLDEQYGTRRKYEPNRKAKYSVN
jgi:hypothetical protein